MSRSLHPSSTAPTCSSRESETALDQEWGETIFFDQPTLTEMVRRADAAGWQVATHSFSLQANELILTAYEARYKARTIESAATA